VLLLGATEVVAVVTGAGIEAEEEEEDVVVVDLASSQNL
jgi:hypothetical protein